MFSSFIPAATAKAVTVIAATVIPVATAAPVVSELQKELAKPMKPVWAAEQKQENTPEPKIEPAAPTAKLRWTCKSCNANERRALKFMQEQGVTDRLALATILGNIKQESNFHANICEGGARIPYQSCRRGGYGLIQWTSINRYKGLGRHAWSKGLSPSTIEAQLSWLVQEHQWKRIEKHMKTPGLSINSYMNAAYKWIGWGIHGGRTSFAYDYANRLSPAN